MQLPLLLIDHSCFADAFPAGGWRFQHGFCANAYICKPQQEEEKEASNPGQNRIVLSAQSLQMLVLGHLDELSIQIFGRYFIQAFSVKLNTHLCF